MRKVRAGRVHRFRSGPRGVVLYVLFTSVRGRNADGYVIWSDARGYEPWHFSADWTADAGSWEEL